MVTSKCYLYLVSALLRLHRAIKFLVWGIYPALNRALLQSYFKIEDTTITRLVTGRGECSPTA